MCNTIPAWRLRGRANCDQLVRCSCSVNMQPRHREGHGVPIPGSMCSHGAYRYIPRAAFPGSPQSHLFHLHPLTLPISPLPLDQSEPFPFLVLRSLSLGAECVLPFNYVDLTRFDPALPPIKAHGHASGERWWTIAVNLVKWHFIWSVNRMTDIGSGKRNRLQFSRIQQRGVVCGSQLPCAS